MLNRVLNEQEAVSFSNTKLTDKDKAFIWARLLMQTHSLLQATTFDPEVRENVLAVCVEAAPRLVRCQEVRDTLAAYEARIEAEYQEKRSAETRYFPELMPIDGDAERFLYEAKNYLRDLTGILRAAFSAPLKDASDFAYVKDKKHSTAEQWAVKTFGRDSRITQVITGAASWISELVRMRNAVEHPNGYSGSLTIQNFGFTPGRDFPQRPTWFRTGRSPTEVVADMTVLCFLMLEFGENLIAMIAESNFIAPVFTIGEIPEENRNPDVPMRLGLVVTGLPPD
jgi:hypothetical protein